MKRIVTISGSDTLSGGGVQADLRTFHEYGLEPLHVLTCIVTVNQETNAVNVYESPSNVIEDGFTELTSLEYDGIKIGMLATLDIARQVSSFLTNQNVPIVLDPVLSLKESGFSENQDIVNFFKENLLPKATLTTPNLREAELLADMSIKTVEDMKVAAVKIYATGVSYVVIKGGQRLSGGLAVDLLYDGKTFTIFEMAMLNNGYINGAGCTFASAIASNLILGESTKEAVQKSKEFVHRAIENGIPFLPGLGNVWQKK